MDAEWSVAAQKEDPILVVPWQDAQGQSCYLDLSSDPGRIDDLAEARAWPEIRSALVRLNAAGSSVFTAKCDAWTLSEEEKQLDFGPVASGFGAYIDVLARDAQSFASLDSQIGQAQTLATTAASSPLQDASACFIVRPAQWHGDDGYALTIYTYGYGKVEDEARAAWSIALGRIVDMVLALTS